MDKKVSRKGAKAQREDAKRKGISATDVRGYTQMKSKLFLLICAYTRSSVASACSLFAPVRLCASLILLLVLVSVHAHAQQRTPVAKETEKERRAKAIELISETAEAARNFKDAFYRVRVQSLAADALWAHDETRARAIFRRAWEAATAFDKAEQEKEERESGIPSTLPMTEARDEVLAKAAARDSKLAESFLRELLDEKKAEKNADETQEQAQRRTPWREMSAAGLRRLALAYELLNQDHPTRAAAIIAPVTSEGASGDMMTFILRLRERSAADADALYASLLERMRMDTLAEANDVLLLSAPLISPHLLVVVDNQGALQFRSIPSATPAAQPAQPLPPNVRLAFYSIAASIIMRPLAPRAGTSVMPEAVALYFAIGRLLPFYEREAAQHVQALRLRNSTLANEIEAGRRETLNSQFELSSLTASRPGDPLRSQLDQLGRARDALDRDRIALEIVRKASRLRLWDRAKRATSEIENVTMRRAALSFIALSQIADLLRAYADDKEDNFDGLAKFVRSADVPPHAAAWGFAQIAVIAKRKGDDESAAKLLDEAEAFAAKTSAGTWERATAYIALTRLAARVNSKRAWELLPEVVSAVNAVEDYVGDENAIEIRLDENQSAALEPLSVEADVFRLDGIFSTFAQLDYEKALAQARILGRQTPQAFASLAIARVMLSTALRGQDSELRIKSVSAFHSDF